MNLLVQNLKLYIQSHVLPGFFIAFILLLIIGFLLSLGRNLDPAVKLERLGIPIALLLGLLSILIGPYGPLPLLPQSVTDIWINLPTPLLTLVFATLMLGRPIPKAKGLIQPVATQALLALLLGFGQYFVGGLVVIFILIPYLNVDPLMGCLIEVGFEGGHGAASIMGASFAKLGFSGGLDLGLAMATIGLLLSTIFGSGLVVVGRFWGWIAPNSISYKDNKVKEENDDNYFNQLKRLFINIAFTGLAVLIGFLLQNILRALAPFVGGIFQEVLLVFPVFPLALLGSLLIRYLLEKFEKTFLISQILQREIGVLATDLLITTAMASLNLPLLLNDWIPLTILALAGLIWNLVAMFFFARFAFQDEWFERSIIEFGNATGVAASGLLLLRLSDPRNSTNTLPIFSIKQLFLQPLLSGGIITVIAPLAIVNLGLKGWTEICAISTILFLGIAIVIKLAIPKASL